MNTINGLKRHINASKMYARATGYKFTINGKRLVKEKHFVGIML